MTMENLEGQSTGGGSDGGSDFISNAVDEIGAGLGLGTDDAGSAAGAVDSAAGAAASTSVGDSTTISPPAKGDPAATAPPPAATTAVEAPRTWRPEAAAEFSKLPPVVQQEIAKREEDIFKGIEGYKEAAAFGNSLKAVLDPYLPTLQHYGIQPQAQVADMMQAHYTLAFGTNEQKLALVQQVIKDYGIQITDGAFQSQEYVDPQVADLRKQLSEIQSHMSRQQTAEMQAKRTSIERHVASFAADPKNVYFEELAPEIAKLLQSGVETTIESAYEKALWSVPAVRAKELSRQQAEKAEADKKAAAEKAEQVRKATAANVRTQARDGSAATPLGSMDDTLKEALAKIRSKS